MTTARITRALASRWARGPVVALALLAGWRVLGPGVSVVALIAGLAALAHARDTAAQDAEARLAENAKAHDAAIADAIDRAGRAMARASIAEARAAEAEASACPLCAANRRAVELARKVASS